MSGNWRSSSAVAKKTFVACWTRVTTPESLRCKQPWRPLAGRSCWRLRTPRRRTQRLWGASRHASGPVGHNQIVAEAGPRSRAPWRGPIVGNGHPAGVGLELILTQSLFILFLLGTTVSRNSELIAGMILFCWYAPVWWADSFSSRGGAGGGMRPGLGLFAVILGVLFIVTGSRGPLADRASHGDASQRAEMSLRTPDLAEFRMTQVCIPAGDRCPGRWFPWR